MKTEDLSDLHLGVYLSCLYLRIPKEQITKYLSSIEIEELQTIYSELQLRVCLAQVSSLQPARRPGRIGAVVRYLAFTGFSLLVKAGFMFVFLYLLLGFLSSNIAQSFNAFLIGQ
jgi:hypothetical protein